MKEIVRQTKVIYTPLKIDGKRIGIMPFPILFTLSVLITGLGCGKVFFSERVVMKEAICVPYEVRDTITVTKTKIKYVESPLSKRIIRDFTKSIGNPTLQVKKNIKTYHGYTPYQLMVWHLKAHESFRPYQYPDGDYPSKGFGLNLTPEHVKWAQAQLGFNPKKRDWTFDEGLKLLIAFCDEKTLTPLKKQYPKLNDFQIIAYAVHKYNTGNVKRFGYCCGSKSTKMRCGRKLKSHHIRRVEEIQLFNAKLPVKTIETWQQKAIDIENRFQ